MSMYPTAFPASPLGFGSALATTTMYDYPMATTAYPTMMPAATTVAYPTMMGAAPAPAGYYGNGAAPMGAAPGFWARHHQKKAMKEHEKAYKELGQGDSVDYYKHQSRAARHEYKFNRKAFQNTPTAMGGFGVPPPLAHPGVTTYESGYSATLYPAVNDFTYGGGYAYEYPTYAAPGSPYGSYGGTWF